MSPFSRSAFCFSLCNCLWVYKYTPTPDSSTFSYMSRQDCHHLNRLLQKGEGCIWTVGQGNVELERNLQPIPIIGPFSPVLFFPSHSLISWYTYMSLHIRPKIKTEVLDSPWGRLEGGGAPGTVHRQPAQGAYSSKVIGDRYMMNASSRRWYIHKQSCCYVVTTRQN
jgi:hypothetical protein